MVEALESPELNSSYYQVIQNPNATQKEKDRAVMTAYEQFGNGKSKLYHHMMKSHDTIGIADCAIIKLRHVLLDTIWPGFNKTFISYFMPVLLLFCK